MAKLGCQGKTIGSSTGLVRTVMCLCCLRLYIFKKRRTMIGCFTEIHVQKGVIIYDEALWSVS